MPTHGIDPSLLSEISHLEIVARNAVEGTVSGKHRSHFMGRNVEFSEHRPYNPGDELRHIDWRAYAKTDRFHIKIFEEDTNLRATLLVDTSASMQFGESTISKAEFANQLSAAISYLMLGQGDSVGIATFDERIRDYVPPRHRDDQWGTLMETLVSAKPLRERSQIADVLSKAGEYIKKRGITILISDLIDDPGAMLHNLALLARQKQEIIVFHVLTPEEIELPYQGTVEFHSMEGEEQELLTTPKRLKTDYQKRVQQYLDTLRNGCLEQGIDYVLANTKTPVSAILREYLQQRMKAA